MDGEASGPGASKYAGLTHAQLVELLEKRDRQKKLGLVWERDEIEIDRAIDENFVACALDRDLCEKPAPWENLVIEGDNFDALRWLRMTLAGRVKCIYIDPPYNTGNKDWVYNDRYFDPNDRFRHSTWLEFLFRRLTLARDLLSEDGVILVSINDDNRAKLELLMDEALPGMRLGSLTWRSRQGSNTDQGCFLSPDHEHLLVYGNSDFRFAGSAKSFEMYGNPDNDPRGYWRNDNLTLGFDLNERPNLYYPLEDPEFEIFYPANPNSVWRYASRIKTAVGKKIRTSFMEDFVAEERILFPKEQRVEVWETKEALLAAIRAGDVPKSGTSPLLREDLPDLDFWVGKKVGFGRPAFKRYKSDLKNPTQPLSSWITPRAESDTVEAGSNTIVSGTNDEGAKAVKEVFGEKAFNYAKPPSLIRELLRQATSPGDIVLDFFAGSGTTAQAVMELNAEDGGGRRFILVSSTEATAEEPEKNLCRDVCAERIRRLNASEHKKYEDLAAGFAYLRTLEIGFGDLDYDLEPEPVWLAIQALHDLPLTPWEPADGVMLHEGESIALAHVDRVSPAGLERLARAAERLPLVAYAWAPAQVEAALGGRPVEVRALPGELTRRFRA